MSSRVERAVAKGMAALKKQAGVSVTYRRSNQSIALTAIPAETASSAEGIDGIRVRTFTRDYLIDAADLDWGSGPVEPAIGDRITEGSHTYELAPLEDSGTPWRWHDPGRTRYRVHTIET